MKIDVRKDDEPVVTEVVFAERAGACDVFTITPYDNNSRIKLISADDYLYVKLGDVDNLIKALQKVKALGWTQQ